MAKGTIAKQTLLTLVTVLAVAFVLVVVLYKYIPTNKIVPTKVKEYKTSQEVATEIAETQESDALKKQEKSYEITDADLNLYRSTQSYNPGKPDPFDDYVEPVEDKTAEAGTSTTTTTSVNTTDNYYKAANIQTGAK